ncbi:ASCH domain-containing protein [Paracoccus albus]|uniref:ASCH domain-containing protein n=1 Tax=Paracoccus albus TaxID=3017784 RepID=UPI0022F01E61|nr:ASCH domain-containing protein [Paracoccus albus]WBU61834.1 ASCH domain-containing protein [Paracoccus albus]
MTISFKLGDSRELNGRLLDLVRLGAKTATCGALRDIPEDFALAEGEGSFDDWPQGHIEFFTRNGGFDPDMDLVCERFRLVEDFA